MKQLNTDNMKKDEEKAPKPADDTGTIQINDHLVIRDPESGEVLLNKRES